MNFIVLTRDAIHELSLKTTSVLTGGDIWN